MMLSTELYEPSERVDASRDALRVVDVSSDGFRELTLSSEGLREWPPLTRSNDALREWPPLRRSRDALREPPLPACPPPRVARPCRPPGICAAARRATLSLSASFRAAACAIQERSQSRQGDEGRHAHGLRHRGLGKQIQLAQRRAW